MDDTQARELCDFPGCTRPRRVGTGRGRPPQYCDLPGHDPLRAVRARQAQRRERSAGGSPAGSAGSAAGSAAAVPGPRRPAESESSGPESPGWGFSRAARAQRVAAQLALASGECQSLAEELTEASAQIVELSARLERAETELAEQSERYQARLRLLGELPRSDPT